MNFLERLKDALAYGAITSQVSDGGLTYAVHSARQQGNDELADAMQKRLAKGTRVAGVLAAQGIPVVGPLLDMYFGYEGAKDLVTNKPWLKTDSEGNKRSTTKRVLGTGLDALMLLGGGYGAGKLFHTAKPLIKTAKPISVSKTSLADIPEAIEVEEVVIPDFSSRVVPGRFQYISRAERLGMDPQEWLKRVQAQKDLMPKTLEDFKQWARLFDSHLSDKTLNKYWESPHFNSGGLWINNNPNLAYYKLGPFSEDYYRVIDNHEFTHYLQSAAGDYSPKFLAKALSEAKCKDLSEIFYTPEELMQWGVQEKTARSVYRYLTSSGNGATELVARIGQLKDFLGLKPNESLTEDMVKYAINNYESFMGRDNLSTSLAIIKDYKKFIDFANTPSVKKYAGMATGVAVPNYLSVMQNKENNNGKVVR